MEHSEITEKIIGVGFEVHSEMGFGFLESVYEKCMLVALREAGLRVEGQEAIVVRFRGHVVGEFVADLLVEDCVIVELKSVRQLIAAHEVQLVNYLKATVIPVGLLMNFGNKSLEFKRKTLGLPQKNPVNPVNPV